MPTTVTREIWDGIELIRYVPETRHFQRPLLFQHGMWHGAWCWEDWQATFAEWGWESVALSLPGHGGSPRQRSTRWSTLGYYQRFLTSVIHSFSERPIVLGHSMGGALLQRYLKAHDDLPAAVMVAPWPSHGMLKLMPAALKLDPVGGLLNMITLTANPSIRTPQSAAKLLLGPKAAWSPEKLHAKLHSESGIILFQHNPPFWKPAKQLKTPLFWLAGELDRATPEVYQRPSARHYGADYYVAAGAGHNLMMDHNAHETAREVHEWLIKRNIA